MRETFVEVFRNVTRRPFQSVLAVIGIFFGMGGILVLSSMGAGVRQSIDMQVAAIGPGMMSVQAAPTTQNNPTPVVINETDAQAVAKALGGQAIVSPLGESIASIEGPKGSVSGYAIGTDTNFPQIESITTPKGHFFTPVDNAENRTVCVINPYLAHQIFGSDNPIGKQIMVNNTSLTVVGTFDFSNSVSVSGSTGEVLLPISTYLSDMTSTDAIAGILLKANQVSEVPVIKNDVLTQLIRDHQWTTPVSDYQVATQSGIVSSSNSLKHLFNMFVRGAIFVAFIVGGIGIMNVMLMAVSDRRKEIGIYLSFGATRISIIGQFLLESSVLTLMGTLLGIVSGTLLGMLLLTENIPMNFTVWTYLEDIGIGTCLGIVFGLYPSIRASRMTPMQAIRE
ncbi:ABC transporter permease [Alicyclobacillus acidiphilus]|uniref:ABC transporter permease n=1 Tax=Alicyclobacillus acidiphilus TaxID=182455 RepID=UPI0008357B0E|nr:ABC transporter permease [Alicyclobacillus acidiphilus]